MGQDVARDDAVEVVSQTVQLIERGRDGERPSERVVEVDADGGDAGERADEEGEGGAKENR